MDNLIKSGNKSEYTLCNICTEIRSNSNRPGCLNAHQSPVILHIRSNHYTTLAIESTNSEISKNIFS